MGARFFPGKYQRGVGGGGSGAAPLSQAPLQQLLCIRSSFFPLALCLFKPQKCQSGSYKQLKVHSALNQL